MARIAKFIILVAVFQATMGDVTPSPKDFFPDIKGNLMKVVWAHAVNSQADLDKALAAEDIMMLEADVVLGNLTGADNKTQIPIMAHPPAKESDLSLEQFIEKVRVNGTKGIKLDFKTIEAFEQSKPILTKHRPNMTFPVFINADVLAGPVNAVVTPVNAKSFIEGAAQTLPQSVLSLGWTTRYGKAENVTEGQYSAEQVKQMLDTMKEHKVSQSVTYPVRAGLIQNDAKLMKMLLENSTSTDATLTIWSSEGDSVDPQKLSALIKEIGVNKVYVDVPADLMAKIDVSGGCGKASMTIGSLLLAYLVATML